MSDRAPRLYANLLKKKLNAYKKIGKALSLQKQALDRRAFDRVFLYSELINNTKDDILSVESILAGAENNFSEEFGSLLSQISVQKTAVLRLYSGNISLIKESMREIERQILSVKLLNKRNSLYNPVSRSEHIDISR